MCWPWRPRTSSSGSLTDYDPLGVPGPSLMRIVRDSRQHGAYEIVLEGDFIEIRAEHGGPR